MVAVEKGYRLVRQLGEQEAAPSTLTQGLLLEKEEYGVHELEVLCEIVELIWGRRADVVSNLGWFFWGTRLAELERVAMPLT